MKYHTLLFFQELGKMSQKLSSAAVVIGALKVNGVKKDYNDGFDDFKFILLIAFFFVLATIRYILIVTENTYTSEYINTKRIKSYFAPLVSVQLSCNSMEQNWKHIIKVRKRAKIRNRYNQAPHLTQDTNGKLTTSQWDITTESQEVSPFPAGDHKA